MKLRIYLILIFFIVMHSSCTPDNAIDGFFDLTGIKLKESDIKVLDYKYYDVVNSYSGNLVIQNKSLIPLLKREINEEWACKTYGTSGYICRKRFDRDTNILLGLYVLKNDTMLFKNLDNIQ